MSNVRANALKNMTAIRLVKESINECQMELKKYPWYKCIFNSDNRKERQEIKAAVKEAKKELRSIGAY